MRWTAIVTLLVAGGSGPLDRAAWLAGCWRLEAGGLVTDEQWSAPLGGVMLGTSRTVRDGRTVEYAYLRLETRGEDVVYVALPSRQAETEFALVPGPGRALAFENPEHDFPKRITYTPLGSDSLVAAISGGGREISFPYARVACPGPTPP